jgi:Flp pilus assembly protein TadD
VASKDGKWQIALSEAKLWQADQCFSSRPAIFGGFIASIALDDFVEAEQILRPALISNRDDVLLHNNLAFALAKQDRPTEAQEIIDLVSAKQASLREQVCLTATQGLIAFRSGNIADGRALYRRAIAMARSDKLTPLANIATLYLVIEEFRAGSTDAAVLHETAAEAVSNLRDPLSSLFTQKLKKIELSPTVVD